MDATHAFPNAANSAFRRAIDAIGGQVKMAELIGRTQGAISKRLTSAKSVWPEHVLAIEAATGVSRHDLRPDIYPREDAPAQPPAGAVLSPAGGPTSSDDALEGVQA